MTGFQDNTTSPASAALDPFKHVKYNLGMVLGVDEFDQEFAYLSNRDQWLARDAIGYGTLSGLKVSLETDSRGPRVVVDPGAAVSPRGQLIRVTPAQCAYLNDWLSANRDEVVRRSGSPPAGGLHLAVVLCYRACPTDDEPVPGEPCRTEDEATVASRLADDFRLELRFGGPDQTEENAIRDFVKWLSQIEISDTATSVDREVFLDAIRNATYLLQSPPTSPISLPDFMAGSPPAWMKINSADACEYLHDAFRVWVTEQRSSWRGPRCENGVPRQECVLLAELDVPLAGLQVDSSREVHVDEQRRPYVMHLRLLQEWLICRRPVTTAAATVLAGDAAGPVDANTVVRLQNVDVAPAAPAENQVLMYTGGHWQPANLPSGSTPNLSGDVTGLANANTVIQLQHVPVAGAAPAAGQVLTFDTGQWRPANLPPAPAPNLSGDVTGLANANTVIQLQHVPVAGTTPTAGQVLTFDTGQWRPANLPPAPAPSLGGDVTGPAGSNTVVQLQHVPLAGTVPTAGQVLTFDASVSAWTPRDPAGGPATGDVVERPPGLPRYLIVAAGIVRADGSHRPEWPIYNGLTAGVTGTGEITVKFDDYEDPTEENKLLYIIKAMSVSDERFKMPIVTFAGFKNGIVLNVSDSGNPIEDGLAEMEFVIEVSQFFVPSDARPRLIVNLNTATVDELRTLPRIGPELANRIIEMRRRRGGFRTLADLTEVEGIGEETLRVIEPFVTLGTT